MGTTGVSRRRTILIAGAGLLALVGAFVLLAGRTTAGSAPVCTVTWDGGGGDDDWNNGLNWDTDTVPGGTDRACSAPGDVITITGPAAAIDSADLQGTLTVQGYTLELTGAPSTINDLTLQNGAIDGAAPVDLTGLNGGVPSGWTGSLEGSGQKTIPSGSIFDASATLGSGQLLIGNAGGSTVLVNDGTLRLGQYNGLGDGAVVDNNATMEVEVGGGSPPNHWYLSHTGGGSAPQVTNDGTFTVKSRGFVLVPFDNAGVLDVQGGETSVQADNGTLGSDTGEYRITAPGELQLSSGARTVGVGATVTGTGALRVNGATVTWDASTDVPNLRQDNGTLQGAGTLTVTGSLVMSGGDQAGSGTTVVDSGATLGIDGFFVVQANRTFDHAGTGTVSSTFQVCGNGTPGDAATFRNSGSLTFSSMNDLYVFGCGYDNESFVNASGGQVVVDMPADDTLVVYPPSENDGTVTLTAGSLQVANGSPAGASDDGDYVTTAPGQLVSFAGDRTFGASASVGGPGYAVFDGGTTTFTAGATLAKAAIDGGQWTGDVSVTGVLDVIGTGALTGTGVTTVAPGATASLGSYLYVTSGHELRNQGTMNQLAFGYLYLCDTGSALRNEGGFHALSPFASIQDYCGSARGVVNEAGATFSVNLPLLGSFTANAAFDNDGTVQVVAGTFDVAGGTTAGESDDGTWAVAAGQQLRFGAGTRAFAPGSSITGPGTTRLASGDFAGTATVSSGTLRWDSGSLSTTGGTTTISSGATLALSTTAYLAGGTVRNEGTFDWLGANQIYLYDDARIENAGTWKLADNGSVNDGGTSSDGVVNEPGGTMTKSGPGTTYLARPFTNDGTVQVTGGTVYSYGGLTNYDSGTGTLTGGTYLLANGAFQADSLAVTTLEGTVVLNTGGRLEDTAANDALADLDTVGVLGTLVVNQTRSFMPSSGTFAVVGTLEAQGANTTTLAGATALDVTVGGTARARDAGSTISADTVANAGTLTGSGTITDRSGAPVFSFGSVAPGNSPGTLTVDSSGGVGTLGGSLDIEIGGTGAGQYDRLEVTPGDYCPCGATLNLTTLPSYASPTVGDTFTIVTSGGITGGPFGAVTGQVLPGGTTYYAVSYTATDVVLTVTALPTLTINDVSVTEGDSGTTDFTFTVARDADAPFPVSVDWATTDGTAKAPSDYTADSGTVTFTPGGGLTQTVTVTVNGDVLNEADETFTVDLSNASDAVIGDGQGVGTILNDDPLPSLAVGDVTVTEGNSGTTNAVFDVTLSAPSGRDVSVDYATTDGTATTADNDYVATSGTLTIAEGSTTGTVSVPVKGDTAFEPDETFVVDLTNPVDATISDAQGTGTITNDDAAVTVNDVTQAEGDAGTTNFTFTVSLSQASALPTNVSWSTADGTATTADLDYVAASGTVNIPAGLTSGTATVTVNGDTKFEANETFLVNLTGTDNGTITDAQGTGTITNDDTPPVMSVNSIPVPEGDSGATPADLTVTLSAPAGVPVAATYSWSGTTATFGADWFAVGGIVSFAPGETSKTIPSFIIGDTVFEPTESYRATLSSPVNATLGTAIGNVLILDDDSIPSISVDDVSVVEGTGGVNVATFTVSLSNASGLPVTVSFATADGTATSPADYTPVAGSLSFTPGDTARTVTVPIVTDSLFEPDETFELDLSAPTNATIADSQGQATIVDDDNTIIVDSTTDAPDANPGDRICASGLGECTLRAAVMEANAVPGTQTVVLQTGATYGLTLTGADEDVAATGDLDVTGGLVLDGNGATVDGSSLGDRILEVRGSGLSVSISDATFTGGSVTATTGTSADDGGAINVPGSSTPLTLTDVTVSDSSSTRYGGGVASASTLTVTSSSFSGNSSQDGGGVAVFAAFDVTGSTFSSNAASNCGGGLATQGTGTASSLTITGNSAGVCGGGLLHVTGGTMTLSSTTIDGNTAGTWGGGVLTTGDGTFTGVTVSNSQANYGAGMSVVGGNLVMVDSDVHDNDATGVSNSAAGGIAVCQCVALPVSLTTTDVDVYANNAVNGGGITQVNGTLSMTGGSIDGNTAQFFGGGVLNVSSAAGGGTSLTGVQVTNNAAALAAGILQGQAGAPLMTVTESTIAGNAAWFSAGGISADAPLALVRSTVSGNTAPNDGAVTAGAAVTIDNSTISSNGQAGVVTLGAGSGKSGSVTMQDSTVTNNAGDGIRNAAGQTFTVANSIVADQAAAAADCSGVITSGGHNLSSDATCAWADTGDVQGTSALLGPLADNGGPTLTHLPDVGSPAIDTGDTTATVDQRGVARPLGPAADKGAVEAPFNP